MTEKNLLKYIYSQFKAEYRVLAEQLVSKIQSYLASGMEPVTAVETAFTDLNVRGWLLDHTKKSIVKSVLIGMGYTEAKTFAVLANSGLTAKVLRAAYSGNETYLSRNIYRNARQMKKIVANTIKQSIKDKKEIVETSRSLYDGYGYGQKIDKQAIAGKLQKLADARINGEKLPNEIAKEVRKLRRYSEKLETQDLRIAYKNALDVIEKGTDKAVERALWVAVQERSRYQASVIARTESATAFGNAFESRAVHDPDVSAIKYTLSAQHKIYDICNIHTSLDLGYGKGVYPLSNLPKYPFHPNCTCLMSEVYRDKVPTEIQVPDKDIQKGMDKAISKAGSNAKKLFTKEDYAKYKKTGDYLSMQNFEYYHIAKAKVSKAIFEELS